MTERAAMRHSSRGLSDLDDTDRSIVAILRSNGRTSLSQIGRRLGLSHVAIKNRIDRLVRRGLLRVSANLGLTKLGMRVMFILLTLDDPKCADHLAAKYSGCPRALIVTQLTGKYHLAMTIVAEDDKCLESISMNHSVLREPCVSNAELHRGTVVAESRHLPTDVIQETNSNCSTACERSCAECSHYRSRDCPACPGTVWYRCSGAGPCVNGSMRKS